MELTRRQIGSVLVVSFAESISLEGETSERFKQKVRGILDEGRRHLVVDLGRVEFIDSSGLGALISALKVLRAAGGDLKLVNLTPAVQTVLDITRLTRVFDVHPAAEDALSSLTSVAAG